MTTLYNPPNLETVTTVGATSDQDITLTGDLTIEDMGLGGVNPGGTGFIDANPINSTSYVAILFAKLYYSGAYDTIGSFQVDAHDASTATVSTAYGGIFFAGLNKAVAVGSTTVGGTFITGFSSNSVAIAFGVINEFVAVSANCFPGYAVGGAHSSGTVYGWGVYVPAIGIPSTIGDASRMWGISCEEDIQIFPNKKLMLNGSKYVKGTTYLIYNSATTDMDIYLDGIQLINLDDDLIDIKFPTRINGTSGAIVHTITSTATSDDPIEEVQQDRLATTDATKTTLATITASTSTTTFVRATVVARRTGGTAGATGDGAAYLIEAAFTYEGTVKVITSPQQIFVRESQAAWNATLEAGTGKILLNVTGAADNNVTWHSTCRIYKVSS